MINTNAELNEIFEYAKKMELDGKALYEEELSKTKNAGLRNILSMLVEAEKNHYEIFCNLQKEIISEVIPTKMSEIKTFLQEIKDSNQDLVESESHLEFYKKVLQLEKEAENYYREKANNSEIEEVKKILNEIADEENRHVILMEEFVKLCSNPESWVEDAEFSRFEDSY